MSRLKEYRELMKVSQQELGERLGTTQQTIARWETGKTPIPTDQLVDIAVLFGCTVDRLLGRDLKGSKQRKPLRKLIEEDDVPYGTLRLTFREMREPVEFPISEKMRNGLRYQLKADNVDTSSPPWVEVNTEDNRSVFINTNRLTSIEMIGDDVEQMPMILHDEVSKALLALTLDEHIECGEQTLAKAKKLRSEMSPEVMDEITTHLKLVFHDGEIERFDLSDDSVDGIHSLVALHEYAAPNTFITVDGEGYYREHLVRIDDLCYLQVPSLHYYNLLLKDLKEDEEETKKTAQKEEATPDDSEK